MSPSASESTTPLSTISRYSLLTETPVSPSAMPASLIFEAIPYSKEIKPYKSCSVFSRSEDGRVEST
jgi:hypothetical protein